MIAYWLISGALPQPRSAPRLRTDADTLKFKAGGLRPGHTFRRSGRKWLIESARLTGYTVNAVTVDAGKVKRRVFNVDNVVAQREALCDGGKA